MELGKTYAGDYVNLGMRDASHVNGVLVTCNTTVHAGMSVAFTDNSFTKVMPATLGHGVVDFNLEGKIPAGKAFWMLLFKKYVSDPVHVFQLKIPKMTDVGYSCSEIVKYDEEGYDSEGYDKNGCNRNGYDRQGYDEFGYDEGGCNRGCG